jgi:predicted lipase
MKNTNSEYKDLTAKVFRENIDENIAKIERNDNPHNLSSEELNQVKECLEHKPWIDEIVVQIKDPLVSDWQHDQYYVFSDLLSETEEKTTKIAIGIIIDSIKSITED